MTGVRMLRSLVKIVAIVLVVLLSVFVIGWVEAYFGVSIVREAGGYLVQPPAVVPAEPVLVRAQ